MLQITSFHRGLVTNVENVIRPWETACKVRDCRSNEFGWLIPRPGRTLISDDPVSEVFVHKSILLAISEGRLKWARIGAIGSRIDLQDFSPRPVTIIRLQGGHLRFIARDDDVYILTGGPPYVVNIPNAGNPTVALFFLSQPPVPTISVEQAGAGDADNFSEQDIMLRLQYVYLSESQEPLEAHQGSASSEQRKSDVYEALADRSEASKAGDPIWVRDVATVFGDVTDALDSLDENRRRTARTTINITLAETPPAGAYVDVYRGLRNNDLEGFAEEGWYWTARFPAGERRLQYTFALNDSGVNTYPGLINPTDDNPNLQYIATNEFRNYAAGHKSKRVWLSYYDPAKHESLYRTFPDFIDLDLGEGYITGLKFIRDNLLIVYATNQIQIINTDPLEELHSVIDFISPQDDVGNPIGCIAPQSIVDMGGVHWFLAANQYVYAFNSRNARTMSDLVRVMFQTIARPIDDNGQPELSKAVGFAYEKDYYISVSSMLEEDATDENNTTLLYQPQYSRWWQDSFGIKSITKGAPERLFAVIEGELFELYTGTMDKDAAVRRVWRNNYFETRAHERYESVHVYCQEAARVDIKAITEFDEYETYIEVENPEHWHDMRAGCDLRGRLHSVEISTESPAIIDRITTNEILENR